MKRIESRMLDDSQCFWSRAARQAFECVLSALGSMPRSSAHRDVFELYHCVWNTSNSINRSNSSTQAHWGVKQYLFTRIPETMRKEKSFSFWRSLRNHISMPSRVFHPILNGIYLSPCITFYSNLYRGNAQNHFTRDHLHFDWFELDWMKDQKLINFINIYRNTESLNSSLNRLSMYTLCLLFSNQTCQLVALFDRDGMNGKTQHLNSNENPLY